MHGRNKYRAGFVSRPNGQPRKGLKVRPGPKGGGDVQSDQELSRHGLGNLDGITTVLGRSEAVLLESRPLICET